MWHISKSFEFDYGHRVWTQEPDEHLSCGHQSVCRHLHGHRGVVHVRMSSDKLNEQGMVTDFVNLNWFKKFLDTVLDHKMVLDENDPLLDHLFPLVSTAKKSGLKPITLESNTDTRTVCHMVHPLDYYDQPQSVKEFYEGLVLVDFVPTSENLSRWLFDIVQFKMKDIGAEVTGIEFLETPKSKSIYHE